MPTGGSPACPCSGCSIPARAGGRGRPAGRRSRRSVRRFPMDRRRGTSTWSRDRVSALLDGTSRRARAAVRSTIAGTGPHPFLLDRSPLDARAAGSRAALGIGRRRRGSDGRESRFDDHLERGMRRSTPTSWAVAPTTSSDVSRHGDRCARRRARCAPSRRRWASRPAGVIPSVRNRVHRHRVGAARPLQPARDHGAGPRAWH